MARTRDATPAAVRDAADRLRRGHLVAFPTETVYGLGASTFNADAIARIYALKGRPTDNPLIAHVLDAAMARRVTATWTDRAETLASRFWPGPLTIIVERHPDVPAAATGGRDTIAVRSPRHPVARTLIEQFGGPISAPSANRSGHVSPTSAAHVAADFPSIAAGDTNDIADTDADIELVVLDGGPCEIGIESTVLDLTVDPPRILRPGSVTVAMLAEVLPRIDTTPAHAQAASPGTRARHYAPTTPARRIAPGDLVAELRAATAAGQTAVILGSSDTAIAPPSTPAAPLDRPSVPSSGIAPPSDRVIGPPDVTRPGVTRSGVTRPDDPDREIDTPHRLFTMPLDPEAYAAALYETLRAADAAGGDVVLIVDPITDASDPDAWRAVDDRLRRATA